ncbi:MAG: beta-ketoacyl-ACP synthase II [Spirochaetia bacterium]|nr:beta-ketoacyl-ACP synthase II [Spirochaetota bacterium]MCX8097162.1 beta-ketoacyl-ACP synthase II [Spirochaetota bacterium]MDW8113086.1 beta-ketoacyl-ACP synthase II [Spirochaetia bacterium]
MRRRIVVTGLGVITSLGLDVDEYFNNLVNGKSGISRLEVEDLDQDSPSKIGGQVKNFDPEAVIDKKVVRRTDRYTHFGIYASQKAIEDSGLLNYSGLDKERVGVIIGSGIGGGLQFYNNSIKFFQEGRRKVNPNFISMSIADTASGYVSIQYGFRGPNYTAVSACASANHSIIASIMHILLGDADVMITGGSEAALNGLCIAGFTQIDALSSRNDEPEKASRPFDKNRDGFVISEGAGILVLESLDHAMKRGAKIYAEITGYGVSGDAYHHVAPCTDGSGAAIAMRNALKSAGISPTDVQLINSHGTSTPLGDKAEVEAIKTVFGEHAYKLKVNSTKSMIGHTLGAAGGVEAVAVVKMLETGKIHPTINQEERDPECDLDFVPNKAIELDVEYAISNSFGFGGHNASVVFKKWRGN